MMENIFYIYVFGYFFTGLIIISVDKNFTFIRLVALMIFCIGWPILWYTIVRQKRSEVGGKK